MATNLSDLNQVLFDQLKRLNNDNLEGEQLERELRRCSAVTSVSKEIVANARVVLDADKHKQEFGMTYRLPKMLESKD